MKNKAGFKRRRWLARIVPWTENPRAEAFGSRRAMRELERSILRKLAARMRRETCWSS